MSNFLKIAKKNKINLETAAEALKRLVGKKYGIEVGIDKVLRGYMYRTEYADIAIRCKGYDEHFKCHNYTDMGIKINDGGSYNIITSDNSRGIGKLLTTEFESYYSMEEMNNNFQEFKLDNFSVSEFQDRGEYYEIVASRWV